MPAAAVGVVGNVIGGYMQAEAAQSAADTQAEASRYSSEVQRDTAMQAIGAQAYATSPGRNIGAVALYRLADLLGIDPRTAFPQGSDTHGMPTSAPLPSGTPGSFREAAQGARDHAAANMGPQYAGARGASLIPALPMPGAPGDEFGSLTRRFSLADFEKDPGYEFRRTEGQRGVENSALAAGMGLSGAGLKAVDRYNQDYASGEFNTARNRFVEDQTDQYNRLSLLAGIGQTSAQQTGQTASTTLNNLGAELGQNIIGAGNARAAGQIGVGNAWNNSLSNAAQMYQDQYAWNQIFGSNDSGGGGGGRPMNWGGTG